MNKKSVAILYLGNFSFDARLINMTKSLVDKQYAVTIISRDQLIDSKYTGMAGVKFVPYSLSSCGLFKYIELFYKLVRLLRRSKYHCIIAGDLYTLASACQFRKNSKIIFDCREIYSELAAHINKPLYRWFWSQYEKYYIKHCSSIMVTASTDLAYLQKKYSNYKYLKWHEIYNFPTKTKLEVDINLRKRLGVPSSDLLVCYQGAIQRGRGIRQLLSVIQNSLNISALIIGDGIEKQNLLALVKQKKILPKVIFLNQVPYLDLFKYTAICDVGWAVIQNRGLSNFYALPNKIFEYALMNKPSIVSNLPNMKKIITEHGLGAVVNERDTSQQINAIMSLTKLKQKNYRGVALDLFIWDTQEKKFLEIINE